MTAAIHGSCVLLGDRGLLICGASGAGKSQLALALITRWRAAGRFAALIGDDRLLIEEKAGRLLVRPHALVAGFVEMRGIGLVKMSHEPACLVRACIELTDQAGDRMPDSSSLFRVIAGVKLPSAVVFTDKWLVERVETFWFQTYL